MRNSLLPGAVLALVLFSTQCAAQQGAATATPALKQAWDSYYASLDEMRRLMEATPRFQSGPEHRAKAYHTLMEMQAMAYNFAIAPRMENPRVFVQTGWQTDVYTLGQNGQDFRYGVVFLDGSQRYRLSGTMGDVSLFLLQMFNGLFDGDTVKSVGNYDWADFEIGKDGRYEVTLSATKEPGNWIQLDPKVDYQFMLIRRALLDWQGDPGDIRLERISEISADHYAADEFDEAAMARRINRATGFVRYLAKAFNIDLYDTYLKNAGAKNKLTLPPGTTTSQIGNPLSNYAMAVYQLADDEALLIEMDKAPDGAYWSFEMGDVWSRPLDFSNHLTSLNMREVSVQKDGRIAIVVSGKDPGVRNWLDTTGHRDGVVVFRNYRAQSRPVPASRVVKLADLASVLPADIARVTPEQRKQAIDYRREGQRRMYDR